MKKFLIPAAIIVLASTAYAVGGLSFNNSQGVIVVDNVSGLACIAGTAPTCMMPVVPWGVLSAATTRSSGNVATSNTFQVALTASTARLGCMVSNNSAVVEYIDVGGSPSLTTSVALPAGAKFNCATQAGLVISDQLNVTSATAGATYVVWAQ